MFTKDKWAVNSANKQEVNSFNGISIADCSMSQMISKEEKEANALLISKAPQLLDFLQKHYRYLNLDDQDKAKELMNSCVAQHSI